MERAASGLPEGHLARVIADGAGELVLPVHAGDRRGTAACRRLPIDYWAGSRFEGLEAGNPARGDG